jgi:hypothetical protein
VLEHALCSASCDVFTSKLNSFLKVSHFESLEDSLSNMTTALDGLSDDSPRCFQAWQRLEALECVYKARSRIL